MVRSYLTALALLTLSATVAAAPTAEPTATSETEPFSFVAWVEQAGENPGGAHLTAPEAVAAKNEAVALEDPSKPLTKRSTCATNFVPAKAIEAAALIYYLATVGVSCEIAGGTVQSSALMARSGNAEIRGSKVNPSGPAQSTSCFQIARTAARIFDNCWQGDGMVRGNDIVDANTQIQVNVLKPYTLGV